MTYLRCIPPLLLILTIASLSAQEPRRARTTGRGPLASDLRPGDRHVVIDVLHSRPHKIGPRPGETLARYLAGGSDVVLALQVENVRGVLARRMETPVDAPNYRWWFVEAPEDAADRIVSMVTVRVLEVLKGTPRVKEGDRLTFRDEVAGGATYGTATIRGVRVDYKIPWLEPLSSGKRYVFFGGFRDDDATLVRYEAYEEPRPGLTLVRTYLDRDLRPNDEFENLTFEQALTHIANQMRN